MGARGPVPTPYARRNRGRRRSHGNAIDVGRPAMPRDLAPEAKAEWRRVVPVLEDMGVLAAVDRGVLIRYVSAWADWCEFTVLLQQSGKLIKGQKGIVRNPAWLLKRDAEQALADLARQLGLTPTARLRAGVTHQRPPDPEEEDRTLKTIEEYKRRLAWD